MVVQPCASVVLRTVSLSTSKCFGTTQGLSIPSPLLADRCVVRAGTLQRRSAVVSRGQAQASLRWPSLNPQPSGFDSSRLRQPSLASVARVASVDHDGSRRTNRRSATVAFVHQQTSSDTSTPPIISNLPTTSVHTHTNRSPHTNTDYSTYANHSPLTNTKTNTNTDPATFASYGQMAASSSRQAEHVAHGGWSSATSASRPTASQHMASISAAPPIRFGAEGAPADFPVLCLGFVACSITAALSVMLVAAVPALLAIRKAAQALERLAEVARDELPGTMAAVRLSGMEMSDLSMELSDLSQEISQGIRSSARAVRLAEDGLRRVGSLAASRTAAIIEERAVVPVPSVTPVIASAARSTKNAIRGARNVVSQVSLIGHLSNFLQWSEKR